ncbi:hypothetical protein N9K77_02045 [bacterium]|nr:hypothetical protein [bacterium]
MDVHGQLKQKLYFKDGLLEDTSHSFYENEKKLLFIDNLAIPPTEIVVFKAMVAVCGCKDITYLNWETWKGFY